MKPVEADDAVSRDWPLFGLYRIRNEPPGFAIPLFRGIDGAAYVLLMDDTGRISGFVRANIDGSIVFARPGTLEPRSARVGDPFLYAFHRPDGSFHVGTRDSVEAVVREDLPKLRSWPFTWSEAASFVGDQEQFRLAKIETDRLLRRTEESSEVDPGAPEPT